eukprot:Opistho-1_new@77667
MQKQKSLQRDWIGAKGHYGSKSNSCCCFPMCLRIPFTNGRKPVEKKVYLSPSGYTGNIKRGGETGSNGLTINPEGRLVLCQHGNRQVAFMNAPLEKPVADFISIAGNYNGKRFNSPNDVVYNKAGDAFFTDPPYGLEKNMEDPQKE